MKNRLTKTVLSIMLIGLCSAGIAKEKSFAVKFKLNELAFSINVLNTIELSGEEVPPFMDVKNLLMKEYKKVASGKKKSVSVQFTMTNARNFLFFMQRGRFKGVDAALFNDISSRLVKAIKKNK